MLQRIFWMATMLVALSITVILFILPTQNLNQTSADQRKSNSQLTIINARVFDGEQALEPTNVMIENGLVVTVGGAAGSADTQIIDAGGKTLLPGLIDSHTHNFGSALQDTIKFGVTTHLDMFTGAALLKGQKESRASPAAKQQADLFSAGVLATAPKGHGTQFGQPIETLTKPAQADDWVSNRIAEGSDFIKLVYMPSNAHFASLDRATAAAIIEAAHNHGLLAVAHISRLVDAQDMLDDGIDGLVHIFADQTVTPEFLSQARRQKLFVIPTLSVVATINKLRLGPELASDSRAIAYLQPYQTQQLRSDFGNSDWGGFDFQIALDNTRLMHKAGIPILAGSDAPNPGTSYGISLHQEMALLVQAGLTPLESLRAATSIPADVFGIIDRGRVKAGQRADLILVDGAPDIDIDNSLSIHSIYKNGQKIARDEIRTKTVSTKLQSGVLSNFQRGLSSPTGLIWAKTDDSMMNGTSTASLTHTDGNLVVSGEVNPGFTFPWAGAGVFSDKPLNISEYTTLEFTIRGHAGTYQVITFSDGQTGAPPSQEFKIQADWQTINLSLTDFSGLVTERFSGLAITAGPAHGQFEYYLKDVKLKQ